MKHYRVVNRTRFICFLTIVILFIGCTLIGSLNLILAEAATEPEYIEVRIHKGDTLWNIAETYCNNNKDIRENIYDICQLNNISDNYLYVGQTILVRVN